MGYTHYWTFRKPRGVKAADLEASYQKAIKACNKIILAWQNSPRTADHERLSGYSAHTKGTYGGLNVNGKGDNAHETFAMREHFSQNFDADVWPFCKTARKPYDTVVTACLVALKYYLGDAIEVSSDGNRGDWAAGTLLAKLVLRRNVLNPIPGRECKIFKIR